MLKHYFSVYKEFFRTCFAEVASFRLNFVLTIIMDNLFYITTLATVSFIFDHVDAIGPWQKPEFMFFIAFMLAVDQLHMTFISENFWMFSYNLRLGNIDFILLKPIGGIFSIFFRHIRPSTITNFFVTTSLLIYYGDALELSFVQWLVVPPLILLSLTLLTSLEILLSMAMFWLIQADAINFLRMQFQALARWPDFVYRYYARKFYTFFIPILLIGSAPVKFVLDHSQWELLVYMIVAIVLTIMITGIVWRRGLRSYESASS